MNKGLLKMMPTILAGLVLTTTTICAQETSQQSEPKGQIMPTLRYVTVDGDEEKFREDWWIQEDWAAGLEEFTLQHVYDNDVALSIEGRAILPEEDYKLLLHVTKPDVGFVHAGYTEYRKYFDGTGGFFNPFPSPSFELKNDMHLDIGNLFIDVGLAMPNWPKIVFGYEHQYKDGRNPCSSGVVLRRAASPETYSLPSRRSTKRPTSSRRRSSTRSARCR